MAGRPGHRGWGHVRQERSGRWSASYVGPDGERHRAPTTFGRKTDADRWLVDERRHVERDSLGVAPWTPPADRQATRFTTGESLADYGARCIGQRPGLKIGTRELYARQWRQHVKHSDLGAVAVRAITPDRVRSWYADLGTDHPARNHQVYSLVRSVLGTAVEDGLIAANPCQIGRTAAPRKHEPKILEVGQLDAVVAALPERRRALVLLAAWCGLRWGEVSELRRKDIGAGVVTVARSVDRYRRVGTPKSGRSRTVVIPPHIRSAVEHHLATYVGEGADALLFTARGQQLNPEGFRRVFLDAQAAAGVDGVRIHDLRHFAGTLTARVGGTVAETMRRLGHSTVGASMTYQAAVDQRDQELAQALSNLAQNGH